MILEQEVSGELETEIGWNNALATPIIDGRLLGGIESEFSATTVEDNRSDAEVSLTVGPSFQLRPTPRTFIDLVGLFGTTDESPVARMYIVWGIQFGSRPGPSNGYYGTGGYARRLMAGAKLPWPPRLPAFANSRDNRAWLARRVFGPAVSLDGSFRRQWHPFR